MADETTERWECATCGRWTDHEPWCWAEVMIRSTYVVRLGEDSHPLGRYVVTVRHSGVVVERLTRWSHASHWYARESGLAVVAKLREEFGSYDRWSSR